MSSTFCLSSVRTPIRDLCVSFLNFSLIVEEFRAQVDRELSEKGVRAEDFVHIPLQHKSFNVIATKGEISRLGAMDHIVFEFERDKYVCVSICMINLSAHNSL